LEEEAPDLAEALAVYLCGESDESSERVQLIHYLVDHFSYGLPRVYSQSRGGWSRPT